MGDSSVSGPNLTAKMADNVSFEKTRETSDLPVVASANVHDEKTLDEVVDNLRRMINQRVDLEPNTWTSLLYFLWDAALVFGCLFGLYPWFVQQHEEHNNNNDKDSQTNLVVWFLTQAFYGAFTGACIFKQYVIGHDCAHGCFSKTSPFLNDLIGHYCLAFIGTSFASFAHCHRIHHLNHNHVSKDAHIPWVRPRVIPGVEHLRSVLATPLLLVLGIALHWYVGALDGSYLVPIGPMYRCASWTLRVKTLLSTLYLILHVSVLHFLSQHLLRYSFVEWYLHPLLWAQVWLFVVAYLEHHQTDRRSKVWDKDAHWSFTAGALETVDRVYGYGLDGFWHHATDGHLAHHLFFHKLPHYHLPQATTLIHQHLDAHRISYAWVVHRYDPLTEFWRCFRQVGLDVFDDVDAGGDATNFDKSSNKSTKLE